MYLRVLSVGDSDAVDALCANSSTCRATTADSCCSEHCVCGACGGAQACCDNATGTDGGFGCPSDALAQLEACDDCGDCALSTRARLTTGPLEAGSYLLVVEGYSHSSGAYEVSLACPSVETHDGECGAHATALGGACSGALGCGDSIARDTTGATARDVARRSGSQ